MPMFYPELQASDSNIPSREFASVDAAVETFREIYAEDLLAVIKDEDPAIEVVWEMKH